MGIKVQNDNRDSNGIYNEPLTFLSAFAEHWDIYSLVQFAQKPKREKETSTEISVDSQGQRENNVLTKGHRTFARLTRTSAVGF